MFRVLYQDSNGTLSCIEVDSVKSPADGVIEISKANGFTEKIRVGVSPSVRDILQQALEFGYVDIAPPAPSISDAFKDSPSMPSEVEDFSDSYLEAFDIYQALRADQGLAVMAQWSTGINDLNELSRHLAGLKFKSISELNKKYLAIG